MILWKIKTKIYGKSSLYHVIQRIQYDYILIYSHSLSVGGSWVILQILAVVDNRPGITYCAFYAFMAFMYEGCVKGPYLINILSYNVAKCGLFFNNSQFVLYIFFPFEILLLDLWFWCLTILFLAFWICKTGFTALLLWKFVNRCTLNHNK